MSMTLLTTDLRAKNDMILLHLLTNQFVSVPVRLGGIGSSALEGYVEAFDVSNSGDIITLYGLYGARNA